MRFLRYKALKSVMGSGRVGPGRAANTQIFPLNTKELAPLAALARSLRASERSERSEFYTYAITINEAEQRVMFDRDL